MATMHAIEIANGERARRCQSMVSAAVGNAVENFHARKLSEVMKRTRGARLDRLRALDELDFVAIGVGHKRDLLWVLLLKIQVKTSI